MSIIRRFLSSWQGLLAGILALTLFFKSADWIRAYDATAGVFDAGILQHIALVTVYFLWGVFLVWIGWQIAFPSMDKWADGKLSRAFENLSDLYKILMVQISFALMGLAYLILLFAVPK